MHRKFGNNLRFLRLTNKAVCKSKATCSLVVCHSRVQGWCTCFFWGGGGQPISCLGGMVPVLWGWGEDEDLEGVADQKSWHDNGANRSRFSSISEGQHQTQQIQTSTHRGVFLRVKGLRGEDHTRTVMFTEETQRNHSIHNSFPQHSMRKDNYLSRYSANRTGKYMKKVQ